MIIAIRREFSILDIMRRLIRLVIRSETLHLNDFLAAKVTDLH